jgi:hypothetical protein
VVNIATNGGDKSIRQRKSECESEMLHERKFQTECPRCKEVYTKCMTNIRAGFNSKEAKRVTTGTNYMWCHVKSQRFYGGKLCAKKGSIEFPMKKGKRYRQNHRDGTNLCMLNFADNKDWYGGGLSESLTWVPGISGTRFEMKIKPPRQGTGMVLLFSSGIDRQGPLFS